MIVLPGIPDVVAAGGMGGPGLSKLRDNVGFNLAPERCKRMAIVVVLSVEISVGRKGFLTFVRGVTC
jgi:hypothetical protein